MGVQHIVPLRSHYGACPICGHKDYCSVDVFDDGSEYIFCRRPAEIPTLNKFDTLSTALGEFVFKGVNDSGAHRFEPKEQYDQRRASMVGNSYRNEWKASDSKLYQKTYTPEEVEQRSLFYNRFLNKLTLEGYHYSKLKKEWGAKTSEWVNAYKIKSLPPCDQARFIHKMNLKNPTRKALKEMLTEFYPEDNPIAGFYMDEKYGLQMYAGSGIIYPIYNSDGLITCLRIGLDFPTITDDMDNEYTYSAYKGEWYKTDNIGTKVLVNSRDKKVATVSLNEKGLPDVSGAKVSGKYKYMYTSYADTGASYGSQVGLYLPYREEQPEYDIVFSTEGEKKCIVGANTLNIPFVDITGVSNFRRIFLPEDGKEASLVDTLVERGCKVFVVGYDADKATNINVLKSEESFIRSLLDHGIQPAVAEWDGVWGKGLDDALANGITPVFSLIEG